MPPMIRFDCPTCLKEFKIPERAVGQKVHCPRCTQLIIIPIPAEIENTPKLDLLLPGGSSNFPPTEPDSSFIQHSLANSTASKVGAAVLALLIILSWRVIPTHARTVARVIGVSCALTGLFWCLISLKTRCKIFVANLILFILSVV
jgi:hypothetical protein